MRAAARRHGFTMVEILVVIAIIGVLAVTATVSMGRARVKAREAKAKSDLAALRDAINLLAADTGKWPNGCPIENTADPEIDMSLANAGLRSRPTVGVTGTGCFWTATEVANWKGPYASFAKDPWGHPYIFDPDFEPWKNCAGKTKLPLQPAVHTFGPDGTGLNTYDCDDYYLPLR